ncbi:unnamed protein product [Didymodactylos carnosus]|uniref:SAM-dependent MTase TRM10-type domain-containing protein n=1 Tax=Didymodactylos carnosus TaxID=1234261 RepID=A0A8S2UAQ8_9BILA|nr:unnamed protein product [Didymodactylos carnosus]CAF4325400.1 unnamed protein product [Didymodactylos carnosus]
MKIYVNKSFLLLNNKQNCRTTDLLSQILKEVNKNKRKKLKRQLKLTTETIYYCCQQPLQLSSYKYLKRLQKLYISQRLNDIVVIDCSFQNEHVKNENYLQNLIRKVHSCFTYLYKYHTPSFIYLCNVNDNNNQLNSLYFHSTSQSYLDLFSREQLIYLTPHSDNIMKEYDHNAIYILGGIYSQIVRGRKCDDHDVTGVSQ